MLIRMILFSVVCSVTSPLTHAAPKAGEVQVALPEKVVVEKVVPKKAIKVQQAEVVSAAPLNQPESSRMREQRQKMEMETEERFIQRLETARMEDEKVRQQQIFEQKLRTSAPAEETAETYIMVPQAEVAPEATTIAPNAVVAKATVEPAPSRQYYLTVGGGGVSFPQADDLATLNGATNVSLGMSLGDRFWLEAGFLYSYQEVDRVFINNEDIDQFSFSVSPKYDFGFGDQWVTPMAGLVLSYTRRQYDGGDDSSRAFDAGLSFGVDFAMNKSVKLGVEGRYMTNLNYERERGISILDKAIEQSVTGRSIEPVENLDYTVLMVNAKMVF